jgi:polysaccharide chain length determinant protein (PEP-CTERM system associated)
MVEDRQLGFADYLAIAQRRLWLIIIPALIVPVLAYTVSLKIQNRYTSQTLVLVQQQKVPDNFVKPIVSEEWNERLMTMQEQILSRTRLQPIIEKFGLYKNELDKAPMEDVLEKMRKAILITPLRSEGSRGVPGFYVSFTSSDPRVAQKVCAQITSMFMEENVRARQQSAEGTTDFLSSQLEDAKGQLDAQDRALAAFKSKYLNQLPGRDSTNLAMLTSLNGQIEATTQAITQAEQQKTYLQSLLAQQVSSWKSKQVEGASDPESLEKRRTALQAELLALQARYTPDHPDVLKAKAAIAQIDQKIADANTVITEGKISTKKSTAIEPTEIVQLRLSIRQLEDSIKSKTKDQERMQQEIKTYQARIQLSPIVEEEFKKLTRDYQTAQTFYDELLNKRRQSEMATELERRQQGEQFRVMDPPNLPEKPTYPNRLFIALGGLAAGLVLGAGSAAVLEMRDQSMRTETDVSAALKLPVLGSIPALDETPSKLDKRAKLKAMVGA